MVAGPSDHLPIVITLSSNDSKTPMPGATRPLPFDSAAAAALDKEIMTVFRRDELITPDAVKAGHASLREAVLAGGWPRLDASRGKVIFVLHDDRTQDRALSRRCDVRDRGETPPMPAFSPWTIR